MNNLRITSKTVENVLSFFISLTTNMVVNSKSNERTPRVGIKSERKV